jgi:hypothetical protein
LCRDSSQPEHINSLFGDTAALRQAAQADGFPNLTPDLQGMAFATRPPEGGEAATDILVRFLTDYARAEWRFVAASDEYFRWSETDRGDMAPLTDRTNGKQLSVSNLVLVFVPFNRRSITPKWVEMYDVPLEGVGQAAFFRDGKEWDGYWRVVAPNRPLEFFGQDGLYPLHPGVTWIGLVGDRTTLAQSAGTWKVQVNLP